jgi:hypothetical protein
MKIGQDIYYRCEICDKKYDSRVKAEICENKEKFDKSKCIPVGTIVYTPGVIEEPFGRVYRVKKSAHMDDVNYFVRHGHTVTEMYLTDEDIFKTTTESVKEIRELHGIELNHKWSYKIGFNYQTSNWELLICRK